MNIRYAALKDLQALSAIENLCFPKIEAADYSTLKQRLEDYKECFWILEKEGQILSFINGMKTNQDDLLDSMYESNKYYQENGDWLMIFGVDTIPNLQHNGYASILMRYVIAECREKKRKGIVLTCKENLISFYEQFNFVNEGVSSSIHGGSIWYQMRYRID